MNTYFHSVRLDEEKCMGCTNCIKRCPTQAIRVRSGMGLPNIKKYTDEMKIDTEKDVGTTISLKVYTAH